MEPPHYPRYRELYRRGAYLPQVSASGYAGWRVGRRGYPPSCLRGDAIQGRKDRSPPDPAPAPSNPRA